MGTFYILMILGLRVIQNYYDKKASALFPKKLNGRAKWIVLMFGSSSILAVAMLVFESATMKFDWFTAGLATISGLTLVVAQLCMLLAMQSGTMAIASVFSTAGLIVPCVFGVLFFNEVMGIWQWIGVALFIPASFLLAASAKDIHHDFSYKTILLLIGAFTANGGTMLCQKTLTYINPSASITLFSLLSFVVPAIVFLAYLLCPQNEEKQESLDRKIYLPTIFLAVSMFFVNQIVTSATNFLPSAVVFTIPNGGKNIIAAAMGALLFKEKLTWRSISGLALSIVSIVLIIF